MTPAILGRGHVNHRFDGARRFVKGGFKCLGRLIQREAMCDKLRRVHFSGGDEIGGDLVVVCPVFGAVTYGEDDFCLLLQSPLQVYRNGVGKDAGDDNLAFGFDDAYRLVDGWRGSADSFNNGVNGFPSEMSSACRAKSPVPKRMMPSAPIAAAIRA